MGHSSSPPPSSQLAQGRLRLQRRTFLKAIGLGLAAPFAARIARLTTAAPGARPTRLLFFYIPHGSPIEHFDPKGADGNFALNMSGESLLGPLEPFKKYVNVMRGVSHVGISNHATIRAALTLGESNAISIDQAIAKALGTKALVLGTIPYQNENFSSDSWLVKDGSWIRPETNPVTAADRLFPSGGGTMMSLDDTFRREAMTMTEKELEQLQSAVTSLTAERSKLQVHLDAVRGIKSGDGTTGIIQTCSSTPSLPAVSALRAPGTNVFADANFGKVLDANLELTAQAFLCGKARVATIQNLWVNSTLNFGFMGVPKGHHEPVSHSWDGTGRAEFARVQRFFYERLVEKFIKVLDQPDPADTTDPTHKVIDNTLIYVFSEVSDGANHHSDKQTIWIGGQPLTSYLPCLTIGGGGGFMRTQRLLDFDNRPHGDMLYTLSAMMGVPQSQFGTLINEVKA